MLKIKNDGKNISVKFSKNLMPEKTLLNFLSTIEIFKYKEKITLHLK